MFLFKLPLTLAKYKLSCVQSVIAVYVSTQSDNKFILYILNECYETLENMIFCRRLSDKRCKGTLQNFFQSPVVL